ncbi:MAG: 2-oxoglutarate dehydrogenase complex dihydrolipoyllysine-residue succinyltransferase [Bacteroidales bacterium]
MIEIKVPAAGESITQVELARWMVDNGSYVEKDQEIAEIDSDKATLVINADQAGKIEILTDEGSTVAPGAVIGKIDTEAAAPASTGKAAPGEAAGEAPAEEPSPQMQEPAGPAPAEDNQQQPASHDIVFSPQAQKLLDEMQITEEELKINPGNKRITKKDILAALSGRSLGQAPARGPQQQQPAAPKGSRGEERRKMSTLRRKVAERLVAVKNQTAMLTTFNEVDMSAIMALRKKHQPAFQEKWGIKLGFMSFFAKAVTESILLFPTVNGYIDEENIVIPAYTDLGIAVSTTKGLMVPVIRNAESMSVPELEQQIAALAQKARDNRISIEDLTGGTFSITNGGVFGSMLSTPILNPPQSAILGMHNIIERPVAINGKVEIRPMMYVALSYDHRVIDGRESVGFLVKIKELLENPLQMALHGKEPGSVLLDL